MRMMEMKSTFDNALSSNPAPKQDWLFGMWMLPVHMTAACWESWMVVSDGFCRTVFRPGPCPEKVEEHDLAVPPPLCEKGEHDLFA